MRFVGNIAGIQRDIGNGDISVTFKVKHSDKDVMIGYDQLKDNTLTIEAKKYRKSRSTNANAYAWKLISELADINKISKDEMYEIMLERYGATLTDDDKAVIITVRSYVDMKKADIHCARVGQGYINGQEYISYRVIKGSSQYDTQEMSVFIDGIVGECKEAGIDTLTPTEIREIKERWGVEINHSG